MGQLKFRCVSSHIEDLADGSTVAPGEYVTLSDEDLKDPHNERLVADGILVGTGEKSTNEAEKIEKKVDRREAQQEKEGGTS